VVEAYLTLFILVTASNNWSAKRRAIDHHQRLWRAVLEPMVPPCTRFSGAYARHITSFVGLMAARSSFSASQGWGVTPPADAEWRNQHWPPLGLA
jgi:hypothetical protein